jgi:antitoxin ParD1/3/4
MSTMNVSLPDPLRHFVEERVSLGLYGTASEYVRELIRRDQEGLHLRGLLVEGAESPDAAVADATWFKGLRQGIAAKSKRRSPARKSTRR